MSNRRKNAERRAFLSSPEGIKQWEQVCGFKTVYAAAARLGVPVRTYHRWKAEGLPRSQASAELMKEIILDKMEAALLKRRG